MLTRRVFGYSGLSDEERLWGVKPEGLVLAGTNSAHENTWLGNHTILIDNELNTIRALSV